MTDFKFKIRWEIAFFQKNNCLKGRNKNGKNRYKFVQFFVKCKFLHLKNFFLAIVSVIWWNTVWYRYCDPQDSAVWFLWRYKVHFWIWKIISVFFLVFCYIIKLTILHKFFLKYKINFIKKNKYILPKHYAIRCLMMLWKNPLGILEVLSYKLTVRF